MQRFGPATRRRHAKLLLPQLAQKLRPRRRIGIHQQHVRLHIGQCPVDDRDHMADRIRLALDDAIDNLAAKDVLTRAAVERAGKDDRGDVL
jgi:hypothetical protein